MYGERDDVSVMSERYLLVRRNPILVFEHYYEYRSEDMIQTLNRYKQQAINNVRTRTELGNGCWPYSSTAQRMRTIHRIDRRSRLQSD